MCPTVEKKSQLSPLTIRRLPIPETGQSDFPDGTVGGLNLRVFSTGARAWVLRYRDASGRGRKYLLGDYPALGLSAARTMAAELRVAIKRGADPLAERRVARVEEAEIAAHDTLGDLIELYLAEHALKELAPRTCAEYERVLTAVDIQELRQIRAPEVTDADVAGWLDRIEKRGSKTMCNRAQTYLSAVYTWAAPRRRFGVRSNPVKGLPRRFKEGGGEKRWLTTDEIRRVFGAADSTKGIAQWAADALWMTLATGQRPGEVLRAKWSHIALPPEQAKDQHGSWKMPSGYRKRVRGQRTAPAHDVPLSPVVVSVSYTHLRAHET